MKKLGLVAVAALLLLTAKAQDAQADKWVDSVFKSLSADQKIAQLMIIRMSTLKEGKPFFYDSLVTAMVNKYNVGGICLFQGGPLQQAKSINFLQSIAKTPLLVTVDGEWGLGMRFDSVRALPRQMTLGATSNPSLVYDYGKLVADQCRRIGIQVNYAPVVDINNNPDNPVINDRSFGEDKMKVAALGIQYMKGLQDNGVMACAKHFPGHGDVAVDSHYDLPVIRKSRAALDSLELYPFRQIFKAGVGSVMIAHLAIPAIDSTTNRPTSISRNAVTGLLQDELHFKGLSFTDALEMQGVAKYYPDGEASAQSLIAGNDLLCLPGDVADGIAKIKKAIRKKKLSWDDINIKVKKMLYAKYAYGLSQIKPIDLHQLTDDLNSGTDRMRRRVAEESVTLLRNEHSLFPYPATGRTSRRVAYIGIGLKADNRFAERLRNDYNAHTYYFDYTLDSARANALIALIQNRYDMIILGVHGYERRPARNFGISNAAIYLIQSLEKQEQVASIYFGNPYAIRFNCSSKVLVAAYEDDPITQETVADFINGKIPARGRLPVTVCPELTFGSGIVSNRLLAETWPGNVGMDHNKLQEIDTICLQAIREKALPGCVVLVAKEGKIVYEQAFGQYAYTDSTPVTTETIYDLASLTKVMATTLSLMKLYDDGKLDLDKTLGDYLSWTQGTDKARLPIREVLLHQAGLNAFIPFYKETIDPADGVPLGNLYANKKEGAFTVRVAENMYLRQDYEDTLYQRILKSALGPEGKYVYSDNDFILLGKVVEAISGKSLDQYVRETFYEPLQLSHTGFRPWERFPKNFMAPTENEPVFRRQLLQGDVHDPGAAMFGGVAGHAGLFSDAYELAVLGQLLLNNGTINGMSFYKPSTVALFTAYSSNISRRGLGFDKPEKDNATRKEPYPSLSVSPETYGHTGFTGTCIWMDPRYNLTYIFLGNRVNNNGDPNKFGRMNVRPRIQEVIYNAMSK
ncbi:glycoside hydrolase family 3 N-terminal domain-containing protein [Flavihumibacter petaseus]|uniref:beta-N-acetylhexosaminidase n=1 Tax=Flavihumibacter petaseus NBRC 106054 TaxID=1220578 RepID=A0A0E9MYT7_9BACT|nr:glycoside hydrolase family 3 N-terminal domain-containing protein [Flavihumibacter petaseus]GAO42877.1 glycosidase [Flavihumibacter petaseus NBRC 106054]